MIAWVLIAFVLGVAGPMVTEAGVPVLTLDLGDGVLVFEPSPDTDPEHAWSRIRTVLEDRTT